jgi:hypothetical protein
MEIVKSSEVKQAKAVLAQQWLAEAQSVGGVQAESLSYLADAVDEKAYGSALSAIASDPNYPKIVSVFAAPHKWFGLNVPGSRTTFDNPDTIYRPFSVDPNASYVIHGHRYANPPIDINFSLWDVNYATLSNLTAKNIVTDANGDYTISVNSSVSDGSANHIQLLPQAKQIFVRTTINDWGVQQFDALRIERVAGPAIGAPLSKAELIARTIANMNASPVDYYNQLSHAQPVNELPTISVGGDIGRLATQIATYSALNIADDEALVLTVDLGGAQYFIAPAYDRWFITTDYVNHTQTLNNRQALPNPDGTFTFVISPSDPHVYNWIDTVGLHEALLNLRWQGLPSTAAATPPSASLKLVKLANLAAELPATTKFVTPDERKAQIAARVRSYASRYGR